MSHPRHLHTSYRQKQHTTPPEPSERGEDERLTMTDLTETTGLVQRTLTGQIASSVCKCGKVCKNVRRLKIHQARSKCGQQLQHKQRKGLHLSETLGDSSQDNHHSAEDIQAHDEGADIQDPNLFDLLDEDASNSDTDTQSREKPRQRQQPITERKPRVKWFYATLKDKKAINQLQASLS